MEPLANDKKEKNFNRVVTLLIDCRFAEKRSRKKAEESIRIWEKHQFGSIYLAPRGLICYPDLLSRYLDHLIQSFPTRKNHLYQEDLMAMICRCIENSPQEEWCSLSLQILLNYYTKYYKGPPLQLLLLPGKYKLDLELYQKCWELGIHDQYLEARQAGEERPYLELPPQEREDKISRNGTASDQPTRVYGYRQAYHRLIYTTNWKCLVKWWQANSFDCTAEATCDYLLISRPKGRLDPETSQILLDTIKAKSNRS